MSDREELLQKLYDAVLEKLLQRIEHGEDVKPAEFEVARKILADNNINADSEKHTGLKNLRDRVIDNLPFTDTRN